jgi:hypothetical protein
MILSSPILRRVSSPSGSSTALPQPRRCLAWRVSARVSLPCYAPVPRAGSIPWRLPLSPCQDVLESPPALHFIYQKLNDLGGLQAARSPMLYYYYLLPEASFSGRDNVVQLSARVPVWLPIRLQQTSGPSVSRLHPKRVKRSLHR